MKRSQNGATLIIVLIVLVLIVIVGTLAVKSGILGLKISTNSQVRSLLLENSNSALFNIEDPNQIARQLALDGMFSYFNAIDHTDDELVFCYRPSSMSTFYSMSQASVIDKDGGTSKLGVSGFCQAGVFSSGRSAVQAQIYLRKNLEPDANPFSTAPTGTSLGQSELPVVANNIGVTVISILPSYAGASNANINACFRRTAIKKDDETETVEECFDKLGIPYNLQHADYIVGSSPKLKS
ncbi:pilus assembly protein PilX [Acinetobacter haemolyticus]|uniref:pilus assembly protein PilX n=1 Tax=Acinetobacter haemolyticus TaxID=29430 RepID=UPI0021CD37EB|nr:pilus assembly protein PilX [Acinetobacter haemolyticus]MCU4378590.1 pilus assembly protein PilX [Acinetobacter haemolyticus]